MQMMTKRERNLFVSIAGYAIDHGCRVSLELKDDTYHSEALNGVIAHTDSKDRGLILQVKPPKENEVEE